MSNLKVIRNTFGETSEFKENTVFDRKRIIEFILLLIRVSLIHRFSKFRFSLSEAFASLFISFGKPKNNRVVRVHRQGRGNWGSFILSHSKKLKDLC